MSRSDAIFVSVTPRDPIIARDSRPFGPGGRMKSLDMLYPSVTAGAYRTMLGRFEGGDFSKDRVAALKELEIAGPLLFIGNELFFPLPCDMFVWVGNDGRRRVSALIPKQLEDGEECNLPEGLWPVNVSEDVKPAAVPAFCSNRIMSSWLSGVKEEFRAPPDLETNGRQDGYSVFPAKDIRSHVAIDSKTGAHLEGQLFMTSGLDFTLPSETNPARLAIRIRVDQDNMFNGSVGDLTGFNPIGGERRIAFWRPEVSADLWRCPEETQAALRQTDTEPKILVRLILATPACFTKGWKPGWLSNGNKDKQPEGTPPGCPGVKLRLVSACVGRWQPISGWSLEEGSVGEKPIRRLVPAGSVYFFELIDGSASELSAAWLESVSDVEQDRNDGFGLALWGPWRK